MRLTAPTLALTPAEARVTATLASDEAGARVDVVIGVPRALVGAVDLTSAPFVPVASVLALLAGEALHLDPSVSPPLVAGSRSATALLARWMDRPSIDIVHPGKLERGTGADKEGDPVDQGIAPVDRSAAAGLFFTRGVDSWAALLRHRHRVTHLVAIDGIEPSMAAAEAAEVWAGHEHVAAALGLPLIRITTNARQILDPRAAWDWTHGAVLASVGLLLSPLLGTAIVAGTHTRRHDVAWGSHPDLDHCWSTDATVIEHADADRSRWDKTASLIDEPLAMATLAVCWEGRRAVNCGRCEKCLRTMTTLDALGASHLVRFDAELSADAVRALPPPTRSAVAFIEELLDHLDPAHSVRAAWASLVARSGGPIRLDGGSEPVSGPSLVDRVGPVLERLGRTAVSSVPEPGTDVETLVIGWGPGEVPLRPAAADAAMVLRLLGDLGPRPASWVVAEPLDSSTGFGSAHLADLLTRVWGPGLTYLSRLAWAPDQAPGLPPHAVARLLGHARVRAWWREDGPLDPLRVLESVEVGCLPLQVMPPGAAVAARRRVPAALATVVVDEAAVAALDPSAVAARLTAVAEVVMAGSIERDIVVHFASGTIG